MKTNIWVGMSMCLLLLVLPAAASDYTLDIFGNANEDDTINMQDVTYTELIILEYKDETQLADAKYDGEIDILDVTQIELIILGREKKLTFVDCIEKIVTVKKPVNRVISLEPIITEVIKAIGAKDKVVGIATIWGGKVFLPELSKLPSVGDFTNPDYEAILELEPDIVIQYVTAAPGLENNLVPAGITVVRVDPGAKVDGKINMVAWHMLGGPHLLFTTAYMAKWFHPDLFEDLDPQAIHQEYLTEFQELDYDLDEHGVFVYPPFEDS